MKIKIIKLKAKFRIQKSISMFFQFFLMIGVFSLSNSAFAQDRHGQLRPQNGEVFSNSEENFKATMNILLEKYIDKNLSKEELYKAATAGMLSSLNSGSESWNKLLSPSELKEMRTEMSGKVTGIGAEMKFDEKTGYAMILRVIPNSVAERAGIKMDDQILSVDGKKFKGKAFPEMVSAIRGEAGKSVQIKVLRDDKVLSFNIKRELIAWTPVELEKIENKTAVLTIGFFNEETPKLVEKEISEINSSGIKNLIVDIRDNAGGGFEQAVKVSELFVPKDSVIVGTKSREGKAGKIRSTRGLLNSNVRLFVLTDKETSSGAELFAAALKENREAKIIGEKTLGKWNAQMIETLPNQFAVKYTIKEFQTPKGNSYQGKGIPPDLEVAMAENVRPRELKLKENMQKRLDLDVQLRAAVELSRAN